MPLVYSRHGGPAAVGTGCGVRAERSGVARARAGPEAVGLCAATAAVGVAAGRVAVGGAAATLVGVVPGSGGGSTVIADSGVGGSGVGVSGVPFSHATRTAPSRQ